MNKTWALEFGESCYLIPQSSFSGHIFASTGLRFWESSCPKQLFLFLVTRVLGIRLFWRSIGYQGTSHLLLLVLA
jgi:hypothetical protein